MRNYNDEARPVKQAPVWTAIELMILRENWQEMDDEQLANVIGKKPAAIRGKRNELHLVRAKPAAEQKIKLPKPLTEKRIQQQIEERKKKDDQSRRNREHLRHERAKQMAQGKNKPLPTRKQDLSAMRTVRIDAKTIVYVKADADVEAIKKRYTRHLVKEGGFSKIE